MPDTEKKPHSTTATPPSNHSKRRKRLLLKMLPLLLIFTIAILVVFYFISPLSEVEILSVTGNKEIPDQEIVDISEVRSGLPLWETFFSKNEVEMRIEKKHPQVKDVEMVWAGVNDFEFKISEWQIVAYLAEDEQYHKILENGTILEDAHSISIGNMPIFREFSEGEALNRLLDEFSNLNSSLHNLISEVKYTPTETNKFLVHVYMNDGNQVFASIPTFSERLQYYPAMLQSVDGEKGVFDFEAGAFFTPFEKSEDSLSDQEEEEMPESPDTTEE